MFLGILIRRLRKLKQFHHRDIDCLCGKVIDVIIAKAAALGERLSLVD